jgi:hypothetical protein
MQPIIVWQHTDGRRIEVYAHCKVRYSGRAHARSAMRPGDTSDAWPILYRSDVPNLSDEQWQAPPVEDGWTAEKGDSK